MNIQQQREFRLQHLWYKRAWFRFKQIHHLEHYGIGVGKTYYFKASKATLKRALAILDSCDKQIAEVLKQRLKETKKSATWFRRQWLKDAKQSRKN